MYWVFVDELHIWDFWWFFIGDVFFEDFEEDVVFVVSIFSSVDESFGWILSSIGLEEADAGIIMSVSVSSINVDEDDDDFFDGCKHSLREEEYASDL